MTVEVLLFGPHARAVGSNRVAVRLADDRTPAGVLRRLAAEHPALRPLLGGARIAVNARFTSHDAHLGAEDELALIGLVGGG